MTKRIYYIPTREQLESLKVGDLALDCFGRMSEVTEIFGRREDVSGKLFVCYYTRMGDGATCSMSMREGELTRTSNLTCKHTSRELDSIERAMLEDGGLLCESVN